MNNWIFHIEVLIDGDKGSDDFYKKMDEYKDSFPYYNPEEKKKTTKCVVCGDMIGKKFQWNSQKTIKVHTKCHVSLSEIEAKTEPKKVKCILPSYITGWHGVDGGICFTVNSKADLEYALNNLLNEDYFQISIKNNNFPKIFFIFDSFFDDELNIHTFCNSITILCGDRIIYYIKIVFSKKFANL